MLDSNTIGGADGKTDVVGSAGQYPHDGHADEPRDQRPQGISADAISPLHVVDGDQQALPISEPREMACDTVDEQQRLGGQPANLLEFGRRQEGIAAGAEEPDHRRPWPGLLDLVALASGETDVHVRRLTTNLR